MNEDVDLEASNSADGGVPGSSGQGASAGVWSRAAKYQVSSARINAQKESFWHDKPRLPCSKTITAHIAIIATKSLYF